jgi:hypothetical protein
MRSVQRKEHRTREAAAVWGLHPAAWFSGSPRDRGNIGLVSALLLVTPLALFDKVVTGYKRNMRIGAASSLPLA